MAQASFSTGSRSLLLPAVVRFIRATDLSPVYVSLNNSGKPPSATSSSPLMSVQSAVYRLSEFPPSSSSCLKPAISKSSARAAMCCASVGQQPSAISPAAISLIAVTLPERTSPTSRSRRSSPSTSIPDTQVCHQASGSRQHPQGRTQPHRNVFVHNGFGSQWPAVTAQTPGSRVKPFP